MRRIFIDPDFRCHVADNGSSIPVETSFFDGKCDTFIEGYRYIHFGEVWTRSDGKVFKGEMIAPWKPYSELAAAQQQYETMLAEMDAAYQEGVKTA